MAFHDTCSDLQFLDFTSLNDHEQKWLHSLVQTWDHCVQGPWQIFAPRDHPIPAVDCTVQTNLNNGIPPMPFEQYHSPVLIPNHVSPISQQGYPQTYQIYPQAFVPQFGTPIMPVVTGAIMPVNTPMVPVAIASNPASAYGQPVTYSTFPPSVQANPIYMISPPLVKETQMNLQHSSQHPPDPIVFNNKHPIPSNLQSSSEEINQLQEEQQMNNANSVDAIVTPMISTANGHQYDEINGTSEAASPTSLETPSDVNSGPKLWTALFSNANNEKISNSSSERRENTKSVTIAENNVDKHAPAAFVANGREKSILVEARDPSYYSMGDILVNYSLDTKITSLQPRGLINRSNYCYVNSILQAILACPPMYNLLSSLGDHVMLKGFRKHTQVVDNMVKFVKEFNYLPAAQRVNRRLDKTQKKDASLAINCDRPFEPNYIYKMLNGIRSDSFVVEGRQEDAEEFLGCLLNGLNDEMLELMKLVGPNLKKIERVIEDCQQSDSDPEWQLIGPKNKGAITRRTEIVRTPISHIFGGHIQTKLHRAGDQISNNIQPFFTLPLNIAKVDSVREALEALVCKNQLEGVTSSKTNEEVEAWQQVTIEELPVVLILHLKCFDFQLDGCTKIMKSLEFPVDLKVDSKLLTKTNYQPKEKQYKLFAVVYHDGKEATKGHYLTDAYHVGYACWLRYDDSSVKPVSEEQVLKPHGNRVPYLLFYRRFDTVRNK